MYEEERKEIIDIGGQLLSLFYDLEAMTNSLPNEFETKEELEDLVSMLDSVTSGLYHVTNFWR